MEHRVFVYGTLLRGELNHPLLDGAVYVGAHRTEPCFTLYSLGGYPGLVGGGSTAVSGEVYRLDDFGLRRLDRLEGYPRLYGRRLMATPFGRAWAYLYRGAVGDRSVIRSGDWRDLSRDGGALAAAAIRYRRDPNHCSRRQRAAEHD
jgi:gamma-glutamylcyclotransferase (GGCT)/AIG2-like uncharacterized protein YtfP